MSCWFEYLYNVLLVGKGEIDFLFLGESSGFWSVVFWVFFCSIKDFFTFVYLYNYVLSLE